MAGVLCLAYVAYHWWGWLGLVLVAGLTLCDKV
jgi:hypothetical protein